MGSSDANGQAADFESVKTRLAEIADAVGDEDLSLDDALALYEEAVALGLQASDLLEAGIVVPDEGGGEAGEGAGESASDAASPDAAAATAPADGASGPESSESTASRA